MARTSYILRMVIHILDGSIFLMNINEFRITYALLTYLCKVKRWNNIDHQEHLLCVKHWFQELDNPQAAVGPSQAFADTPIGPSLLKLDESQRKRLESLFNTAYSVVKAGKPFSDYELICEIQVKNGLDLGENYRNINGCKAFAASIAQTLVDKQLKFQILSYKLGLGKSLTGLRLKKFK